MGFIGPVPESYLDVLSAFNEFESNYSIAVLLADFIFPIIILNLLGKKVNFSHFKRISFILAQLSAGLILFIIILAPIKFYAYMSIAAPSSLEIYYIINILLHLLLDSIILLVFLFCIYKLRIEK